MSKKKSNVSTMTLKDFHGGSIPSDLHLPSAPGVTVRPPDRPGYDRPIAGAWGPAGRPEHHRPRPGSAGGGRGSRGLEDRGPPFLPNTAHIGRHFDEDERKPFDPAAATPRRLNPIRSTPTPASPTAKRPLTSPAISHHFPAATATAPVPALHNSSVSAPNAWAVRKDSAIEPAHVANPTATVWSGPAAVSMLAQASAIEKVSSGRWHSKPSQPDVEVVRFHDTEGMDQRLMNSVRIADDVDQEYGRGRTRPLLYPEAKERNAAGIYYEGARNYVYSESKERDGTRIHERARSPMYPEAKERNAASFFPGGARPASSEGRIGGTQLPQQGVAEGWERSKLKLPRAKLLEPSDPCVIEDKQSYQPPVNLVHVEKTLEIHGSMNVQNLGSPGSDASSRAERRRLNLKPRSLPVEQSVESAERERKTLFGGARPRELVLKERGVDNFAVNNNDVSSPANRLKSDTPKTDLKMDPATRHGERAESYSPEHRSGRDVERKDYRLNAEKGGDAQRTASWRNDNRRNPKEMERPLEPPRRQEADTWRKTVDQPKPDDDPAPHRLGKAASALELAQAFSRRSVSDPRISSQSLPGRTQVPFSRLTAQRQINGY